VLLLSFPRKREYRAIIVIPAKAGIQVGGDVVMMILLQNTHPKTRMGRMRREIYFIDCFRPWFIGAERAWPAHRTTTIVICGTGGSRTASTNPELRLLFFIKKWLPNVSLLRSLRFLAMTRLSTKNQQSQMLNEK